MAYLIGAHERYLQQLPNPVQPKPVQPKPVYKPNRATEIVAENLIGQLENCSTTRPCSWEAIDAQGYYEDEMIHVLEGNYDVEGDTELDYPDWLPLVSTPDIKKTIDWAYVAEKANELEYDMEVEFLFGDE
jgi:hypothetical protein